MTKKQLEERRTAIGASEIAALAGLSKWASPIQIYEAKVTGAALETTYAMELGNEFEAPIARVWARMNQRFIANVATLRHPEKPYAIATPDRAVYVTAESRGDARMKKTDVRDAEKLLQVKSTNWRMRSLWGHEGTDSIPDEYLCQAHWEGAVAGQQIVDFAVDFDKTKLCEYRVTVSLEVFEKLYEIAERFMVDHVLAQRPPPPDASDAYGEYLARVFPRHTRDVLDPVDDAETIIEDIRLFARFKSAEKRIETLKKLLYHRIAARISGAAGISGSFGKITFKATKDRRVTDWQKVADEALRIASLVVQSMPEGDHRAELAEDVRKLIETNTKTVQGYRVMRPTWAGPLKLDAETIELRLDALKAGLEAQTEEEQVAGAEQQ